MDAVGNVKDAAATASDAVAGAALSDGLESPVGPDAYARFSAFAAVAAGGDHSCALRSDKTVDRTVVCWGLGLIATPDFSEWR